jgi:transposase-like protein
MICPVNVRHDSNIYGVFFMAKFNAEDKIAAAQRYLNGNDSYQKIGAIGAHSSLIKTWVKQYEINGVEAFQKSYTSLSTEFKLDVLKYMNDYGTSPNETAAIFKIADPSAIRKWSRQFEEHGGKIAPNVLNRDFTAENMNEKWVTDVTEFRIFGEKRYLSPVLDLCNGEIIAYSVMNRPVYKLVGDMLNQAIERLQPGDKVILHSDQGWHYQMGKYQKN